MSIESIEQKLVWTRAALGILRPIVGLCLAALSISLLARGEPLAAGVWMIAAFLAGDK